MKHLPSALVLSGALASHALAAAPDFSVRQVAPPDGWAAQAGGTRGGADAPAANVFTVTNAAQLRQALGKGIQGSRIVQVAGLIDMSEGRAYTGKADQARRALVALPADTTLVGVGADAGTFTDRGSLLNGAPLAPCGAGTPSWTVPYPFNPRQADAVPAHVRAHAGAGK